MNLLKIGGNRSTAVDILIERYPKILDILSHKLLLSQGLETIMKHLILDKPLHLLGIPQLQNLILGDLQHADNERGDGFVALEEEQVDHLLGELVGGVAVGEQGVVVLAEQRVGVHAHLVDIVEHIGHTLADLLLQFLQHLEYILIIEHLIQSQHNLPEYNKNIPLILQPQSREALLIEAEGLQAEDDHIEEDVVHALGVLDAGVGERVEDFAH